MAFIQDAHQARIALTQCSSLCDLLHIGYESIARRIRMPFNYYVDPVSSLRSIMVSTMYSYVFSLQVVLQGLAPLFFGYERLVEYDGIGPDLSRTIRFA